MKKPALFLILVVLILLLNVIRLNNLIEKPVDKIDEEITLIASSEAVNGNLTFSLYRVPTHPSGGFMLYGLPTIFFKDRVSLLTGMDGYWSPEKYETKEIQTELAFALKWARLMLNLMYFFVLIFVYLIGKKLINPIAGLLAVLFLMINPEWDFLGKILFFEIPQLLFLLSTIWYLIIYAEKKSFIFLGLSFLSFFLAMGMRINSILFLPLIIIFACFLLIETKSFAFFYCLVLGYLAFALFSLIVFFYIIVYYLFGGLSYNFGFQFRYLSILFIPFNYMIAFFIVKKFNLGGLNGISS